MASTRALSLAAKRSLSSAQRRSLHQSNARYAVTNMQMPAMSPTMTEGGIASWKKKEGESFATGDVLLEIETDKATIEVEAQDDGVVGKIIIPDGTKNVPVGKVIALLAEEGDDISNLEAPKEEEAPKPAKQETASSSSTPPPPTSESKSSSSSTPTPQPQSHSNAHPKHSRPLFPSVYRLLAEYNITDAEKIVGTGVRGMLTKGDVLTFLGKASGPLGTFKPSPSPIEEANKAKPTEKKAETKPLDGPALRQLIVSTMLQNSIKARSVPAPAAADFDSIISDYLPPTKPSDLSSKLSPIPSNAPSKAKPSRISWMDSSEQYRLGHGSIEISLIIEAWFGVLTLLHYIYGCMQRQYQRYAKGFASLCYRSVYIASETRLSSSKRVCSHVHAFAFYCRNSPVARYLVCFQLAIMESTSMLYPFNPSLLTTNVIPDETDDQHIRQLCSEYAQDLGQMDAQIKHLKASLDTITKKRDILQAKVTSLKAITSPLRRLPTEVLQHIFLHSLAPFSTLERLESPLLLTQICSRWRSVAIDTPELWAAIHVFVPKVTDNLPEPHRAKIEALREGLGCFLSRSRSSPLSISLYTHPWSREREDKWAATLIFGIIMRYHQRWKHLILRGHPQVFSPVERLQPGDLPCLETLNLKNEFLLTMPLSTLFDLAPRLYQLSLPDGADCFHDGLTQANLVRLTHLAITRRLIEMAKIMPMLMVCTNLTELSLNTSFRLSTGSNISTITLPKLERLVVVHSTYFYDIFFNSLTVPGLRELILKEDSDDIDVNIWRYALPCFENLVRRSSCCLINLEIQYTAGRGCYIPEPDLILIPFLKVLSHLNHLVLPFMSEDSLRAFTVASSSYDDDDDDVLCPKLTRIEFNDHYTLSEQALTVFLSTRVSPPVRSSFAPLTQIRVWDVRTEVAHVFARFGGLVEVSYKARQPERRMHIPLSKVLDIDVAHEE
ncbi:hypothetical protein D9758_001559 [Tetrapyrgos nigripes]|uniref:Uncharacterized protein n=1 Tax=Tetrapyrgos nigripes TaxID=182062 RepID=A0A8H5GXM5_9AGAR|nr:hypothetical protein D9758_001559 [Tetrapyrgos nigripes]